MTLQDGIKLVLPIDSLSPRICGCHFKCVNFKHNLGVDILSVQVKSIMEWGTEDLADGKSTLVQVMAWCHQATSHYLNQCRATALMPYGITKTQWVHINLISAHFSSIISCLQVVFRYEFVIIWIIIIFALFLMTDWFELFSFFIFVNFPQSSEQRFSDPRASCDV